MCSESLLQDPVGSADSPGWLGSIILGVVEGLTEFLPVSSTGHLIVTNAALGQSDPTFEIAIQVGAITAILLLYRRQLWRSVGELLKPSEAEGSNLLILILVAALPASILGLLFVDEIEELLFSPSVVAMTLIAGGIVFLVVETYLKRKEESGNRQDGVIKGMSLKQALGIGMFQTLALIPGTSRSGATILGGLFLGFSRTAAAEFSFLLGLPILYGACFIKMLGDWERVSGPIMVDLLIASGVSFVTALVIIGPFLRFLRNHSFRAFAYYRIVAGGAIFALIGIGWL
ncbi:MAG: undecaprenyl-diphosphate phosphatase [Planctomycetota bacterium]